MVTFRRRGLTKLRFAWQNLEWFQFRYSRKW